MSNVSAETPIGTLEAVQRVTVWIDPRQYDGAAALHDLGVRLGHQRIDNGVSEIQTGDLMNRLIIKRPGQLIDNLDFRLR